MVADTLSLLIDLRLQVEGLLDFVRRRATCPLEVTLHPVSRCYAQHLEAAESVDLDETGLFLQVASRMLLAESSALLPHRGHDTVGSEEQQPASERDDLDLGYLAAHLRTRQGQESFAGHGYLDSLPRATAPRPPMALVRAWAEMRRRVVEDGVRFTPPAFVRLEVAVSGLIRHLRAGRRVLFAEVLRGASRNQAVMHFLAVLELARRREAVVRQASLFGDIALEPAPSRNEARHERAG